MFTGIVRTGRIESIVMQGEAGRIKVTPERPFEQPVDLGDSIAVNGACLTVAAIEDGSYCFDVLAETFDKTNLGEKTSGSMVNLERALALGDMLGGHIVTGHVDGTGRVKNIEQVDRDWKFTIQCAQEMLMLMVYKGSIALDGISLTVAELLDDGFVVHIIPHTIEETDMSEFKIGTKVNLEADILGKHVQRILEFGGGQDYRLNFENMQV
ncbi:riboflavin synthase [Tichowtungia aerotolerans]|uniref:Riboflavin synthase n=1 Tax=Tichowtungia aerotolerans TaxID=2697043 RepID=A0A6P1M8U6_9BACT|nr:riboflavin synthase [Tichowtungia aerotolerans]QHI70311.1 riboflavin synthase [Tichowtungia aerotolerans]